ncbi:MAG TPA: hypothetical protein VFE15_02275 [Marmoricola sp.]|jgi:hypothetical protein|nr:hypothetical protein [Marmoricola sp.]
MSQRSGCRIEAGPTGGVLARRTSQESDEFVDRLLDHVAFALGRYPADSLRWATSGTSLIVEAACVLSCADAFPEGRLGAELVAEIENAGAWLDARSSA